MGVHYHKRPIIKDGLVFEIDAGNRVSYSGAGITSYELVNRNNATLVNGIAFSNGAWIQDGVDDYVNCESGGTGVTACQVPVSLGF